MSRFDMNNASEGEDEDIRNQDGKTRCRDINSQDDENYYLTDVGAGARKLEKREDVTQVMVDDIHTAEA